MNPFAISHTLSAPLLNPCQRKKEKEKKKTISFFHFSRFCSYFTPDDVVPKNASLCPDCSDVHQMYFGQGFSVEVTILKMYFLFLVWHLITKYDGKSPLTLIRPTSLLPNWEPANRGEVTFYLIQQVRPFTKMRQLTSYNVYSTDYKQVLNLTNTTRCSRSSEGKGEREKH